MCGDKRVGIMGKAALSADMCCMSGGVCYLCCECPLELGQIAPASSKAMCHVRKDQDRAAPSCHASHALGPRTPKLQVPGILAFATPLDL